MTHEEARRLAAEARERSKGGPASDMTMRDYFAAKAMHAAATTLNASDEEQLLLAFSHIVRLSYALADAMLKERDK